MIQESNQIIESISNDVLTTYQHIKSIDNRQMFEKDDDVGAIFQEMVSILERLGHRTQDQLGETIQYVQDQEENKEELRPKE